MWLAQAMMADLESCLNSRAGISKSAMSSLFPPPAFTPVSVWSGLPGSLSGDGFG